MTDPTSARPERPPTQTGERPAMKVLILGGTGLASTSVAQQLIDRGEEVTVLNRGRTPSRLSGRYRQWTDDLGHADACTARIRSEAWWDCVIDMVSGVPERATVVSGACAGIARQLVFCSSTNVYPKPADSYPVRDDHRLGATFPSGIGKIRCEEIYREGERRGDYALTVVRPGQIYGETGGVLHSLGQSRGFLDRVRRGKPVIVHGDGLGLWSALHADDVARVFTLAAGNPASFGRAYNAAGDEWMTWDQYYERIALAMDVAVPPLVHVPVEILCEIAPGLSDQVHRSLRYPGMYDMSRARDELGWRQTIPFVEGMRRTLRWLIDHDRIAPWDADGDYERILAAYRAWRT